MLEIDKNLSFCETTHTYFLKGIEVLSVTKALELSGVTDFTKVRSEILERAQSFGRALHKLCEMYDNGISENLINIDPVLTPYLIGWKKFLSDVYGEDKKPFIAIEKPVYHMPYGYAGTLDRADAYGRLIDIKSSNSIHISTAMQTAGYAKAFEKLRLGKVTERWGVRVFENGYEITKYTNKSDFDDFMTCLRMAQLKRKLKIN